MGLAITFIGHRTEVEVKVAGVQNLGQNCHRGYGPLLTRLAPNLVTNECRVEKTDKRSFNHSKG